MGPTELSPNMLSAWEVEPGLAMCDGGEFSSCPSEWVGEGACQRSVNLIVQGPGSVHKGKESQALQSIKLMIKREDLGDLPLHVEGDPRLLCPF